VISAPATRTDGRPVVLTGLASAALLDGRGDLELPREMRGTVVECGGVIGQCVRLTGAWRIALRVDELETTLPATRVAGGEIPGGWSTEHHWNDLTIVQNVAAASEVPGVVRSLRVTNRGNAVVDLRLTSSFRPVLAPVLVEGIQPHRFALETRPDEVRVRQRAFGLSVRWSVAPSFLFVNRASWRGGHWTGRIDEVGFEHSLPVDPGLSATIVLLIRGGLERDLDVAGSAGDRLLYDPEMAARTVAEADRAWTEAAPRLSFPDAPELERGYGRACAALRRLYSAPGDGMTGLVAGYPWYAALWCRDLAWLLDAVAWLGDLDWMRRSIDTVLRYQCRASLPVVGGERGELPMQISPGPVFFYGTSDTTLYYPRLMETWLARTGTTELPNGWADALDRVVEWGRARTDPTTGLLRNGGEAEEIAEATAQIAHVRYGIDAPDTTIWDSADRREHAIDVQVLWWECLETAARLRGARGPPSGSADRLAASLRAMYPWPEEGYLFDSRRGDRGVGQVRPNALRAVSGGIFTGDDARTIVARAARGDLTVPWGVRTLSDRDPTYDPTAYHGGQVWTIATAWLADAALAAGEPDLGVEVLKRIATTLDTDGLGANECFRGDRPEPFDSCFLLGFSVAPFLTTLFRRLWGLEVDARRASLGVRPAFPDGWSSARLERLRIGAGSCDLDWAPGRVRVRWSGPGPLTVEAGAGEVTLGPGATADVPARPSHELS
jgi:glycogen debranching enzyme